MPYVDFKAVKAAVSIEDAANLLKLSLKKSGNQLRGGCPACGNEDERILAITPARGLFYCFDAKTGGDCIALVQHITGLDVQDAAAFLSEHARTTPHAREEPHSSPSPKQEAKKAEPREFDPAAFASKLAFTDEVAALGLTEADATRLGIGYHPQRKAVYFPQKDDTGFVCGFIGWKDGKLVMPPRWLEQNKVVKLRA
jgi:DNA primase